MTCAIPDPDTDTVVITGGLDTLTTVSVYSVHGWVEDLPSLNIGRYLHACTSYMSGGKRVRIDILSRICTFKLYYCRCSLLVEDGLDLSG